MAEASLKDFIRGLAIDVYGEQVLSTSTITGRQSNKSRKSEDGQVKEQNIMKLDEKKLMAIYGNCNVFHDIIGSKRNLSEEETSSTQSRMYNRVYSEAIKC